MKHMGKSTSLLSSLGSALFGMGSALLRRLTGTKTYRDSAVAATRDSAPFDRIVSCEMLEAVGVEYYPEFFKVRSAPEPEQMVLKVDLPRH